MGTKEMSEDESSGPSVADLVQFQYLQVRFMAEALNAPEYVAELVTSGGWEQYALDLARSVRGLDLLLTKGAPFPEEWVVGITTP